MLDTGWMFQSRKSISFVKCVALLFRTMAAAAAWAAHFKKTKVEAAATAMRNTKRPISRISRVVCACVCVCTQIINCIWSNCNTRCHRLNCIQCGRFCFEVHRVFNTMHCRCRCRCHCYYHDSPFSLIIHIFIHQIDFIFHNSHQLKIQVVVEQQQQQHAWQSIYRFLFVMRRKNWCERKRFETTEQRENTSSSEHVHISVVIKFRLNALRCGQTQNCD